MSDPTQTEGAAGSRDENKISTFSVPYYVRSFKEVVSVGKGTINGLVESTRSWQAWNDGTDGWMVTVVYKGHMDEDSEAEDPVQTEQWDMDFSFAEEPLESHLKLADIKAMYGGYIDDGELKFPEFLPNNTKGKSGLGKKSLKAGDKNPLFGATTYKVMTASVTRSWSSKKIPKSAINDIGKIFKAIPGAPDEFNEIDFGDRDWQMMPPKISQNGNVWRIENELLLSPPGGWVDGVYEPAAKS